MTSTRRQKSGSPPADAATRARLLGLLRTGTWTVDDLAERLELTDNAVRFHIAGLEKEGAVARTGVRRRGGAGQPATLYSLTRSAEEAFSRAYAPVLAACLEELREAMPTSQLVSFLKRVGKRLAREITGSADQKRAPLSARVANTSAMLNALGGITRVEKSENGFQIVGLACPLATAVEQDHCVCAAVTALVAEVADAEVREQCDRSGRPKCCFEISAATPRRVSS